MSRPRIRSLKPEFWHDERMVGLSLGAHLLYVGLITQADDEGRQSGNLALLKACIFPFNSSAEKALPEWLAELAAADLVVLYEAGGRRYIGLPSWADDQRIDKAKSSQHPAPPDSNHDESGRIATDRDPSRSVATGSDGSQATPPSRAPADRTGSDQDLDQEQTAPEGAGAGAEDIATVFETWVAATERDPSRTKLDPERRRLIDKRLRSHGLDDCLAAVRNIGASTGDNSARDGYGRGHRFDDLKHALGKTEQIERWREAPTTKGAGAGGVASSRDLAYLDDGVLSADYDDGQDRSQAG